MIGEAGNYPASLVAPLLFRIVIQLVIVDARCSTAGLTGILYDPYNKSVPVSRPPLIADRSACSLVAHRFTRLVRSRDSTRRSAEYTSKTWPMVRDLAGVLARANLGGPREESQWDCALPTSGWRYRFFSSEQSGIHGNSSWCTAREARSHRRVALFRSVHVARNFSIVFDHAREETTTGHLAVKSFPPDCASKRYRYSYSFFFCLLLLVRFLPTVSMMPKHLSRNANVFPRHKLFLLSCRLCFWTVRALVHDLLRSDVRVIIP